MISNILYKEHYILNFSKEHTLKNNTYFQAPFSVLQLVTIRGLVSVPRVNLNPGPNLQGGIGGKCPGSPCSMGPLKKHIGKIEEKLGIRMIKKEKGVIEHPPPKSN